MGTLRNLWERITRKKPVTQTAISVSAKPDTHGVIFSKPEISMGKQAPSSGVIVNNRVYNNNRNIFADLPFSAIQRYPHDSLEEALRHRHVGTEVPPKPEKPSIKVAPFADAHTQEMIDKFLTKHSKADQAHRIMVLPSETKIVEPSYTLEEALRVRNNPNHPINRPIVMVVPKPT
jgi:hypothetical protein